MTKYVGLDWASNGWFGVVIDENSGWRADLFPSIWSVWKYHSDASRILIDIPIGLPTDRRRACDKKAKDVLAQRQGTVFYTPIRDAVYTQNLEKAKRLNEETAGFSIQNQAWSIVPRIREVDEFLDMYPSAHDRVFETHPEVCFWALNGQQPLAESKRTDEGIKQRTALLADEYTEAMTLYKQVVERYTKPTYAPTVSNVDDIVDALAAAVTARRPSEELATLPKEVPPTDERGLPMQITYPDDTKQTRLSSLSSHG